MDKNKKKKVVLKLKKFEELRQQLVLAHAAPIPASSTSPSPSTLQRNSTYDSSGSCISKSSHSHGRFGSNYEEFEDSEEIEGEFGPDCERKMKLMLASSFPLLCLLRVLKIVFCCMIVMLILYCIRCYGCNISGHGCCAVHPLLLSVGTANMVDSLLSSSSKVLDKEHGEDCLVLHESHAQPTSQEEAVVATTFLGRGADDVHPFMLSAGTTNMAGSLHPSSSKLLDREYDVSHSNSLAGAMVSAKGKAKAGHGGSVFSSSPSIAKENDVALLGKGLGNIAVKNGLKDGQALNDKWKDLFSSNRSAESGTKLICPPSQFGLSFPIFR